MDIIFTRCKMSIDPTSIYQNLSVYRDDNILWSIPGPLSGDLTAGLSVATITVIHDLYKGYSEDTYIEIIDQNGDSIIADLYDRTQYEMLINNYEIVGSYPIEIIANIHPEDNHYGWWIPEHDTISGIEVVLYSLYSFATLDFVQGFISACSAFDVDFRDYSAGTPFTYHDHKITNYDIQGYDIAPFNIIARIPAATGPLYELRNEADPFGVDYE
jgi:hypothetical protein